jgi:hypothetical protein
VLQKVQKGAKGGVGEAAPMLHVSVIRHLDRHLDWYRYFAVSLQVSNTDDVTLCLMM